MNVRLAVPNNPVYSILYENLEVVKAKYDLQIFKVDERTCIDLFMNNRVDAALLTPYGYGRGVTKADFRIIPKPLMTLNGYTGIASIFFREGLINIDSCAVANPDDYLVAIAYFILAERFDIQPKIIKDNKPLNELLKLYDSVISYQKPVASDISLDISEEWFDSFEMPLPLAFWITRADEFPINIQEIVTELAINDLQAEINIVEQNPIPSQVELRTGKILTLFDENIEQSLDFMMHQLYYHQLIPEIAAVKVLGRD